MSAVIHIRAALTETLFPAPRVRGALDQLIDSLDEDLDRAGYRPSSTTEARLENLLSAMREAGAAGAAPEEDEEEQRDTQRLS